MKIVVAMTGASGSIYGIRLLQELKKRDCEVFLIVTRNARKIMEYETGYNEEKLSKYAEKIYDDGKLAGKWLIYV